MSQSAVQAALQKYQTGQHIHLGHPDDSLKSPDEREEIGKTETAIFDAILAYELKRGGLVIENNIYKKTSICGPLVQYRNNETLNCCVEN